MLFTAVPHMYKESYTTVFVDPVEGRTRMCLISGKFLMINYSSTSACFFKERKKKGYVLTIQHIKLLWAYTTSVSDSPRQNIRSHYHLVAAIGKCARMWIFPEIANDQDVQWEICLPLGHFQNNPETKLN